MELVTERPQWFKDALEIEHKSSTVNIDGADIHFLGMGKSSKSKRYHVARQSCTRSLVPIHRCFIVRQIPFCCDEFQWHGGRAIGDPVMRGIPFIEDVWGVVTETKMEKPIVVGHSFGGMVSLVTAGKYSSLNERALVG